MALAAFNRAVELGPITAHGLNIFSWILSTSPQQDLRNADRAVDYARQAVESAPDDNHHWNTFGVALYRQGKWQEAIAALTKSSDLTAEDDKASRALDRLVIAMCHWQLGNHDVARRSLIDAVELFDSKNLSDDEWFTLFRDEAEALIQ